MKLMSRFVLVAILLVLGLTITQPPDHAQAAGYFFRWVSTTPGTCGTGFVTTGFTVAYSLPASGSSSNYAISINGGPTTSFGPVPLNFFGSGTTTSTFSVGTSTPPPPYTMVVRTTNFVNGASIGANIITINCLANGTTTTTFKNTGGGGKLEGFTDGRCNLEADQSVTVYPDNKGGFIFYAVYLSKGYVALHVTKAQLDANPDTGVTHLIAENLGVRLYRLAGGGLQVNRINNSGNDYAFNLGGCGVTQAGFGG